MATPRNSAVGRTVAQVALGIPLVGLGAVIVSNIAATSRWAGPESLALTGVVVLVVVGGVYLLNRTANAVARRTGSARLPWLAYSGALLSVWAAAAALLLTGAQFSAPAGQGSAGLTIGAAVATAVCVAAFVATVAVGIAALVRSRAVGAAAAGDGSFV